MTSKTEKDKARQVQEKCQSVLNALLRDEDNKYCVDCDSKGPRWASWNLGVFLCIRCAGIHRNLGVHISKVKSVNLDSWTPEQVVSLQQMGNSRARAVYEANLPDNFRRPQNDSSLESFIRAKYEHKKYIAREWVPPVLPKVNWEKEIEEEMERLKRKKKTVVEKKQFNSAEVPQLPKPKNPSPKPGRVSQHPVSESKQNTDLLGLQNGEDGFSGFVSAPVAEEKKTEEPEATKSEEESFFNQTAPTEKEKVKLTKDSILALYGNTPPVSNFNSTYQNQVGQVQYQQFPGQQNFQSFSGFPQQSFPVQNGLAQYPVPNQYQQFPTQQFQTQAAGHFAVPNQFQNVPVTNLQFTSQGQFQAGTTFPSTGQFQAASQFQNGPLPSNTQFQTTLNPYGQINHFQSSSGFPGQTPVANPFFANQSNSLHQQFTSLSLNNQAASNSGPTLATNLWP